MSQTPQSPKEKKLLDQYRDAIRLKHYSYRTEETYISRVREFILFHNKRHPKEMGTPEINQYLTYLVTEKQVSASTQNQALSAILFLYRNVLHIELAESELDQSRPKKSKTIPTVLSKVEARAVISKMTGIYKIIVQIMYGGGLRVMETLRLRVRDIDFDNHQIIVRDGKGENDRVTVLPESVIVALKIHLKQVKLTHEKDLANGHGPSTSPTRSIGNTPMPPMNGFGSIYSLPSLYQKNLAHEKTLLNLTKLAAHIKDYAASTKTG